MIETFIRSFHDPENICSLFKQNESARTRGHSFFLCKKTVQLINISKNLLLTES